MDISHSPADRRLHHHAHMPSHINVGCKKYIPAGIYFLVNERQTCDWVQGSLQHE